ncbi:hypothetical protein Leryth_020883 [Lithospermum erythrorhizon]|nr:hypothetical protein Leryth_020883 [Lithospermum erythrorhizon]
MHQRSHRILRFSSYLNLPDNSLELADVQHFQKSPIVMKDVFTAPVFRSRPEPDFGFLNGGFWKYSTKPSNSLAFRDGSTLEGAEGEPTIKDDLVVSSQDIGAGLVRMGILPRILYLLETNPWCLEDCLISILIAIARHSPTCATAIMNCQRLVETIVNRFVMEDPTKINPSKIKSVKLLKVLACTQKINCVDFISHGVFQKVCIKQGYGLSFFPDLFNFLSIWLDAPELGMLSAWDVLEEYAAIANEMYLVLESLTRTLPNFYQTKDVNRTTVIDKSEAWCWKKDYKGAVMQSSTMDSLLWLMSSVLHMLSGVLEAVVPQNVELVKGFIPDFVPRITLAITKNGFMSFSEVNDEEYDGNIQGGKSFLGSLCYLRQNGGDDTSMASVCCLYGMVKVAHSVDKFVQLANPDFCKVTSQSHPLSEDDKIVANGILRSAQRRTYSRCWGASGGGFFSITVLLAQLDARLLGHLLWISETIFPIESLTIKDMGLLEMINSAVGACLVGGPRDGWNYGGYQQFGSVLSSHFRKRWLCEKNKIKSAKSLQPSQHVSKKGGTFLDTIHEEVEISHISGQEEMSLVQEWAHQRAGLFFSLGLEAMSAFLPSESQCFVWQVPVFGSCMLYLGLDSGEIMSGGCLNFQSDLHESYSTFIETLVEQFAAVSFGDILFGRQIAIYLHMFVESPVKLATWKDDEKILEAYAQSWVSGALDRAATPAFTLALHHLSSFVFGYDV